MRKLKYLLLIIVLLLGFNVYATSSDKCEKEEFNRLKELAKKVEFDYSYKLVDDVATFSIQAVNLNRDLKVLIIEDYYSGIYKQFNDNSEHKATIDGFNSGEKVIITIKGYVPNRCSGETVYTKTIKLPYYNYFYSEELCNGNEDFKYCKQLLNYSISEKTFNTQYSAYINGKYTTEQEVIPPDSSWKFVIIIGSIVLALIVIAGVATYIVKKRRKNSL